ncbi:hypothetical protein A4A49_07207 [Nicotiana attenuata]|uniref:Uncharacterized protein n=1 Tax=Nicotiana attenuata TaxID=49451 RepID=A0A314L5H2_NICAT|nr:hypothetical protein A4A49_07207 [Nicotiana attenuata]
MQPRSSWSITRGLAATLKSPGTQSTTIKDAGKTPMEQWPPLSATKEGMKTPPAMVISSEKLASGAPTKNVNPSSSKTEAIERNLIEISGELGAIGDKGVASKSQGKLPTVDVETGQKQWANLFIGNRLAAAKGMDLSFIAPIPENGEDVEEVTQKWKQALILYVVGGAPTIGAMERFIERNLIEISGELGAIGDKGVASKSQGKLPTVDVETGQKQWANLFIGNRLAAAKGMDLSFIAPIPENGHKCKSGDQLGQKPKSKNQNQKQKQKQEWQPKTVLKVQEAQAPTADNGQHEMAIPSAGENGSTSLVNPNSRPTKGDENQAWQKVIGKSAAKSRETQVVDTVNMINGFKILTESRLQLPVPRQMEEGTSRQRSNTGQDGPSQSLFIPV